MKTKKPIITIPDTSANKDAGLTLVGSVWYARYTDNGKQRRMALGLVSETKAILRGLRDKFYKELLAAGATVATKGPKPADTWAKRRQRVKQDPDKYLRRDDGVAKPYTVWLDRRQVAGPFTTKEAARKARNRILNNKQAET